MRIITLLMLMFFSKSILASTLDEIRENFTQAVTDKNICKQMIEELQYKTNDPLYLGYLGGFQAIWAAHVFNPFSKLKSFRQGKISIEKAITKDANNVELRYIRFSIQKNAPSFLGYNKQMQSDGNYLQSHKTEITSAIVFSNIEKLLKEK